MFVSLLHVRERVVTYLSENERLFVVGWVQAVVHHHAGAKLFADGVGGKAVHIHFDIRADLLIR